MKWGQLENREGMPAFLPATGSCSGLAQRRTPSAQWVQQSDGWLLTGQPGGPTENLNCDDSI